MQKKAFINTPKHQFHCDKAMNYRNTFFVHKKNETCFWACFFVEVWCLKPCVLQGFCKIFKVNKKHFWSTFWLNVGLS